MFIHSLQYILFLFITICKHNLLISYIFKTHIDLYRRGSLFSLSVTSLCFYSSPEGTNLNTSDDYLLNLQHGDFGLNTAMNKSIKRSVLGLRKGVKFLQFLFLP